MREANRNSRLQLFITKIEIVQKRSIMYFQVQKARSFLKIFVGLPTMVAGCRGTMSSVLPAALLLCGGPGFPV
jgi:DNA polymerase delta subunit 1